MLFRSDAEPFDDDLDEVEASDLPSNLPAGSGDFEADLRWAWKHISSSVEPKDAPNGCAWFLWHYGRSAPEKFVPLVQKSLGAVGMYEQGLQKDREFQFGLLANITREFADTPCVHCGESLNALPSVSS